MVRPVRVLVIALLIAATPCRLVFAETESAQRLRLEQRYDALFQQMLADPQNLDLLFEFAQVAGRLGNFESAVSTLERMLILNPKLPRVRLELGVLYFRLGSYETAKTYLTEALESQEIPPAVERRILTYLAETERELSPHKLSGNVFFGLRYQSNANAAPSSNLVRARGRDAILDDVFVEDDDMDVFFSGAITHAYDFQNQRGDRWESQALGYVSRQFDLSDLDLVVFELRSGPRSSLLSDSFDTYGGVQPYVIANLVRLDDQKLFHTLGSGIRTTVDPYKNTSVEGWYEFRHEVFSNSRERPNASELTSNENEIGIGATYALSPKTRVGARSAIIFDNAVVEYNDNTEFGVSAWLAHEYVAPFALAAWPWTVFVKVEWNKAKYSAPDPAIDPVTRRSDREWRLTATNTARFSKTWALETQVFYTNADSNLPNFEFQNTAVTVGLSARF